MSSSAPVSTANSEVDEKTTSLAVPPVPVPKVNFPPFEYADLLAEAKFGDWRDQLATEGFVVVKEAVAKAAALRYREQFFAWVEDFGLGFSRDDKSTFKNECLPAHIKGGMFHNYGITHEDFIWKLRLEQGVIDAFAAIWGTDELITSFDGGCVMLPHRTDVADSGKWEHTDQSPSRQGFYCVQGLMNLNECGPDDGGLMVLKGSAKLFQEHFDESGRSEIDTWGPVDWFGFSPDRQKWFLDRGSEWVKVCASPGDLILWDSRTVHYNVRPTGDRDRVCTYICMAPASLLSESDRALRQEAFQQFRGTTHVPFASIYSLTHKPMVRPDTGLPCALDTGIPRNPRQPTSKILQLAGIKPY